MTASTRRWLRGALFAQILTLPILTATTASAGIEGAEGRRFCLVNLMLLGTGTEIGCSEPKGPDVVDTSCQAFEPFRWSRRDTPESIAQAKEHNAAWSALCGKGDPK